LKLDVGFGTSSRPLACAAVAENGDGSIATAVEMCEFRYNRCSGVFRLNVCRIKIYTLYMAGMHSPDLGANRREFFFPFGANRTPSGASKRRYF
jgi:hypothetical protein